MFAAYKKERGAEPVEDVSPTEEQVSAIKQILDCDRFPYACFSIFGPFGKRMLAKMVYLAYLFMPDGSWQKKELPGPPTFEHWWASFRVFRVALLLLKAVPPELLDNYADMVKRFASTYGPQAWFIVYQAEVRMRSENFERLRRRAERVHETAQAANMASDFDPQLPWATVFRMAVGEECKNWWDDNLHRDALLFLTHVRSADAISDDGTVQPSMDIQQSSSSDIGGSAGTQPKRKSTPAQGAAAQKRKTSQQSTAQSSGRPQRVTGDVYSKKGRKLCDWYNDNERCRFNEYTCLNSHACKQCLQTGYPQSECQLLGGSGRQRAPFAKNPNAQPAQ